MSYVDSQGNERLARLPNQNSEFSYRELANGLWLHREGTSWRLENAVEINETRYEDLPGYELEFAGQFMLRVCGEQNYAVIQAIAGAIGDLPREQTQALESPKGTISYGDR